MIFPLRQSLAFLLGFSFAFLPGYGPFLSILLFFQSRVFPLKMLGLWSVAAFFLVAPLFSEGLSVTMVGILQVFAPFTVYVAFSQLPRLRLIVDNAKATTWGLLSGFGLVVALGLLNIDRVDFAFKSLSQSIIWQSHPALYGHTVLLLGGLVALLARALNLRLLALGIAGLGILISGSREAALAWVVLLMLFLLIDKYSWRRRLFGFLTACIMLALSIGFGGRLGWGNVGFLLDIAPSSIQKNLVQGSELPNGDWWDTSFTSFKTSNTTLDGQDLTVYDVTKLGPESWLRLQQVIPIESNQVYTVSVWLKADRAKNPGIQGWTKTSENEDFIVSAQLNDGVWYSSLTGQGRVIDAGLIATEGDWYRGFVSFIYDGPTPKLNWYVGLTPDQSENADATSSFAGFQLEQSMLTSYTPGSASRGLSLGVARAPYWQAAWGSISESLWLGHGSDSFPDFYQEKADQGGQLQAIPAHVHNLYLHFLFERGVVGFLGLLLFLLAISIQAIRQRDALLLSVIGAVLFVNFFDLSLFYGAVLYPLVAISGLRSNARSEVYSDSLSKQLVVRLVLAAADFLLVYGLALLGVWLFNRLGYEVIEISQSFIFALLLWPVMALREGLYPGYGLSAAQELKKQVTASFYAVLILAAGTLLFEQLQLPRFVLFIVLLSVLLLPIVRLLTKTLLLSLDLWGKPVVILGANALGKRVSLALINNPLNGLNPLAVFDDDSDAQDKIIAGIPVLGKLSEVEAFTKNNNMQHVIVAIDSRTENLPNFHSGSSIRTVQYVPELALIPSEGVYASSLEGLLALEVRLGLRSASNRWVKRFLDLVCSALLIILLSPIFLSLYFWVRFDSSGSAFYKSKRVGQEGQLFGCLKFRTMHDDADAKLESILETNKVLREEYETYHKLEQDPRITRCGRFLRKFSLDELPQLFNVFVGQMSLIGPRPYLLDEQKVMDEHSDTILAAKPGMTGYWQISARNSVSFQERLEMEAYYVRNWSIWWDIVILLRTPLAVLNRKGR